MWSLDAALPTLDNLAYKLDGSFTDLAYIQKSVTASINVQVDTQVTKVKAVNNGTQLGRIVSCPTTL